MSEPDSPNQERQHRFCSPAFVFFYCFFSRTSICIHFLFSLIFIFSVCLSFFLPLSITGVVEREAVKLFPSPHIISGLSCLRISLSPSLVLSAEFPGGLKTDQSFSPVHPLPIQSHYSPLDFYRPVWKWMCVWVWVAACLPVCLFVWLALFPSRPVDWGGGEYQSNPAGSEQHVNRGQNTCGNDGQGPKGQVEAKWVLAFFS